MGRADDLAAYSPLYYLNGIEITHLIERQIWLQEINFSGPNCFSILLFHFSKSLTLNEIQRNHNLSFKMQLRK